jgi:nitrate reductase assembly molybdenum cofactor insertion protein NarJ
MPQRRRRYEYVYIPIKPETWELLKRLKKYPQQPYWHIIETLVRAVNECKEKCSKSKCPTCWEV